MDNLKKAIVTILCTCMLMTSFVPYGSADAKVKTKKITLNKKNVTLQVGKTFKIKVKKVTPKKASKKVTFKTSAGKIAKVSKQGVIKGVSKGNATITVTSKSNKKAKAKVKVKVINMKKATPAPTQVQTATQAPIVNTPGPSATPEPVESLYNPDYSELVSRSDLTHKGIITFSPYGMPVANGRFGGPVWQDNKSTLAMQLNHTDTFMYNDASANSGGESGGLGKLSVNFGSEVLDDNTSQLLSLYDARLNIESSNVGINVIADNEKNAIYINVDDKRDNPSDITIDLNMHRAPIVTKKLFSAVSSFDLIPEDNAMTLNQVFSEKCDTGIEVNDHYCATSVAVTVLERTGSISKVGDRTARMTIPGKKGKFTIVIGGASSMDEDADVYNEALDAALTGKTYDDVYKTSSKEWEDFWSKSYVYLPDNQDFEQRRTYYMYLAGISNKGKYPSKYNGGIWIAEGDRRDWGNYFWNWNQDSLYQPFNSANHMELMDPMYELRDSCYEQYKMAARQIWGIDSPDALFIGEASGVLGHETMPEDISEELIEYYDGYANTNVPLSDTLKAFGTNRNTFLVPWNFGVFDMFTNVSYVSHTMAATQENAEYYWQKYCYTKDEKWLRDKAYKYIKGAAELYRNYKGFYMEDDGYYHFHRTNLHEHIWGGKDIIDDLTFARGIFEVAIKASEILNVDKDLRAEWQDCLDNIAPYPLSTESDAISHLGTGTQGKCILALGRTPAHTIRGFAPETPQFKMLEKFDVMNMETRDQELDDGLWDLVMDTYYETPGYKQQVLGDYNDRNGSSRFLENIAKLGQADDFKAALINQYQMFADNPNLLFDQGDYYSAEGYGTWANGIQAALFQSISPTPTGEDVIRVFPAWPKEWDAKYKLLAKGGFLVSSSMVKGDIQYVEIVSQIGGKCRIRNPWKKNIVLYRNGVKAETIKAGENELITFDTGVNEGIVIVREGTTPDEYKTKEVVK